MQDDGPAEESDACARYGAAGSQQVDRGSDRSRKCRPDNCAPKRHIAHEDERQKWRAQTAGDRTERSAKHCAEPNVDVAVESAWRPERSEERRVGKECRSRWSP